MSSLHIVPDEQRWVPTHVQVTVLRARGLRAKGKHGTSDVYTIIQVGKEKFSTSVVEKTTAPEWKEECSFELLPGVLEVGGLSAYPPGSGDLVLTVMHRALIGLDVFLGQATIPLDKVFQDGTSLRNEWYKLHSKSGKKEKERGEVQITVQFTRNNLTASMYDLSMKDKSRSTFGKLKDKMKGKKRGEVESASAIVPSGFGALSGRGGSRTASEGGAEEEDDEEGGPKEGKKNRMKNFFQKNKLRKSSDTRSNTSLGSESSVSSSPGGSLSPTAGISVVVSDLSNSPSNSSSLTVDSPVHTIQPSPRLQTHKRAFSDEASQIVATLPQPRSVETLKAQSGVLSKSSLCINGSHVYNEPTAAAAPSSTLPASLGLMPKSAPLSRSLQNLARKSEEKTPSDTRRWSLDKPGKEAEEKLGVPSAPEHAERGGAASARPEGRPVQVATPMVAVAAAADPAGEGKKHKLNLFSHGRSDSAGKGGEGPRTAEQSSGPVQPPAEEKHKGWFGSKDGQNKPSLEVSPKVETSSDAPFHLSSWSPDHLFAPSPASAVDPSLLGSTPHVNPFTPSLATTPMSPSNPFFISLQCNPFFEELLADQALKSATPAPYFSSSPLWASSAPSSWPADPGSAQDGAWKSVSANNKMQTSGLITRQSSVPASLSGSGMSGDTRRTKLFPPRSMSEITGEWDESFDIFATSRLRSGQKDMSLPKLPKESTFHSSLKGYSSPTAERSSSFSVQCGDLPPVPPRKSVRGVVQDGDGASWLDRAQEFAVKKEARLLSQADASSMLLRRQGDQGKGEPTPLQEPALEPKEAAASPLKEMEEEAKMKVQTPEGNAKPLGLSLTPKFVSTCSVTFMKKSQGLEGTQGPDAHLGRISHQSHPQSHEVSFELDKAKESFALSPEGTVGTSGSEVDSGTRSLSDQEVGSELSECELDRNVSTSLAFTQEATDSAGSETDSGTKSPAVFGRWNLDSKPDSHRESLMVKPDICSNNSICPFSGITPSVPQAIADSSAHSSPEFLGQVSKTSATKSSDPPLDICEIQAVTSAPCASLQSTDTVLVGSTLEAFTTDLEPYRSGEIEDLVTCGIQSTKTIMHELDISKHKSFDLFADVDTDAYQSLSVEPLSSTNKVVYDALFQDVLKDVDPPAKIVTTAVHSLAIEHLEASPAEDYIRSDGTTSSYPETKMAVSVLPAVVDVDVRSLPAFPEEEVDEVNQVVLPVASSRSVIMNDALPALINTFTAGLPESSCVSHGSGPAAGQPCASSKSFEVFSPATEQNLEETLVLSTQPTTNLKCMSPLLKEKDLALPSDTADAMRGDDKKKNDKGLTILQVESSVSAGKAAESPLMGFDGCVQSSRAVCDRDELVRIESSTPEVLDLHTAVKLGESFGLLRDALETNRRGLPSEVVDETTSDRVSQSSNSASTSEEPAVLAAVKQETIVPPCKPPRLHDKHFPDKSEDRSIIKVAEHVEVEDALKMKDNRANEVRSVECLLKMSTVLSSSEKIASDHYGTSKFQFPPEGLDPMMSIQDKGVSAGVLDLSSPFEIISEEQTIETWKLQPSSPSSQVKEDSSVALQSKLDKSWLTNEGGFEVKDELNTSDLMIWSAENLEEPSPFQEKEGVSLSEKFSVVNRLKSQPTQSESFTAATALSSSYHVTAPENTKQNEGKQPLESKDNDRLSTTLNCSEHQPSGKQSRTPGTQLTSPGDFSSGISQDLVIDLKPEDICRPLKTRLSDENPFQDASYPAMFGKNNPFSRSFAAADPLPSSTQPCRKKEEAPGSINFPEDQSRPFLHDGTPLASSTPSLVAAANSKLTHLPSPVLSSSTLRPATGTAQAAAPSSFCPPPPIASAFAVLPEETQPAEGFLPNPRSSPHPVKPLSTTAHHEEKKAEGRSVLASGLEKLKSTIAPGRTTPHSEPEAERTKSLASDGAARYYHLTHDELITLVLEKEAELEKKGAELKKMAGQVHDLEDYIDSLLVRIMEQTPTLLQVKPAGK
ncbi:uro-adherence factor A isoform X1 [Lepisosteus oculatus]|uniref:uro-adherence factor A isoform X1 n=1 Tax=Lepisosteus oculatus TaxID=7918 RepID=UPI0035F51337